jgi:outer membrane protein OmpA-like peptidoglycan-associated protein
MIYSSNFLKSKIFALFFAIVAISAYSGEGSMNFNGQLGVHKTQSAQTLGHGRFGTGLLLEGARLKAIIENQTFCWNSLNCPNIYDINGSYLGANAYPFLSFGVTNYFDVSIGIPIYGELLKTKRRIDAGTAPITDDISAGGWGDLFISTKWRVPFNENFPLDLALLAGFSISTGRENDGGVNAYGPWVRDPIFLNIKSTEPIDAKGGAQSTYSNANPSLKIGLATTFDFGRIKAEIPILLHLNGTYKTSLGTDGENYPKITSFSAALEFTPVEFISIFGEYYRDMPLEWPAEKSINLSTASFGTAFHLGKAVDLQFGMQMFIGDRDKYVDDLTINMSGGEKAYYNARLIPNFMPFGGLTVKISTIEPKKEEVKKEYRNPDTDEDGVCDPWVAEAGKQNEFSHICKGIDLCPYEQGKLEDKGCPVQETKVEAPPPAPAPAIIFTAMPDVVQKGNSVTLTWQVTNATSVSIDGIGDVPTTGTKKVKPTENTVFKLTAVGEGGTQTATADVEIAAGPLPVILFTASSESVQTGHPVTLKWQITNATEVSIEGIGKVQPKGSKQLKPTESTVYTLTAVGEGGTQTEAITVEVTAAPVIEARVNLQGVTFGSGNATLTANAKKILDGVAEQLLANPKVKIEIQGHTDNVGKPATNRDLSERRAKAVVAYLAMKGIKMNRMRSVGYGQDVPIADNSTPEGRELNRRIEMIRMDD